MCAIFCNFDLFRGEWTAQEVALVKNRRLDYLWDSAWCLFPPAALAFFPELCPSGWPRKLRCILNGDGRTSRCHLHIRLSQEFGHCCGRKLFCFVNGRRNSDASLWCHSKIRQQLDIYTPYTNSHTVLWGGGGRGALAWEVKSDSCVTLPRPLLSYTTQMLPKERNEIPSWSKCKKKKKKKKQPVWFVVVKIFLTFLSFALKIQTGWSGVGSIFEQRGDNSQKAIGVTI